MDIQIINPITHPNWNELLETNPRSSFFHTSNWSRVLAESYGYTPLFFCRIEKNRLISLLPLMEVDSWLTGRRGVSLPFTDAVPLIADNNEDFQELFEQSVAHGKAKHWKYLEFRSGKEFFPDKKRFAVFMNHRLPLHGPEDHILKRFRSSTRRNIKRAQKNGVKVTFSNSLQAVKNFFRLNCAARQDHGLPPQPFHFFRKLHDHVLSKGRGTIASGIWKGKTISSNVYLFHRGQSFYKFGANDRKAMDLRSSYLVMWEAIRIFLSKGFELLDFGRTDMGHHGLLQFKNGWGTREAEAAYFRFSLPKQDYVAGANDFTTSYSFFKITPIPVLKLIGTLLYRHAA